MFADGKFQCFADRFVIEILHHQLIERTCDTKKNMSVEAFQSMMAKTSLKLGPSMMDNPWEIHKNPCRPKNKRLEEAEGMKPMVQLKKVGIY